MGGPALELQIRSAAVSEVARRAAGLAARLPGASGGLLFATGRLALQLSELSAALAVESTGIPWLLGSSTGLIGEDGEVEDSTLSVALVWSGGTCSVGVLDAVSPSHLGRAVAEELELPGCPAQVPRLLLLRSAGLGPSSLPGLSEVGRGSGLFGAGTPMPVLPRVLHPDGKIQEGIGAVIRFQGMARPLVGLSHACRVLAPPGMITRARGPLVLEIDGLPALDYLESAGHRVPDPQLLLVALTPPGLEIVDPKQPPVLLRMLHGIDPNRRALVLADPPPPGTRITFAQRDSRAARSDFELLLRDQKRRLCGGRPRFGIFIDCVGRGKSLYGSANVDYRAIVQHHGKLPLIGLKSAFELGPFGDSIAVHTFSALFALFTDPS